MREGWRTITLGDLLLPVRRTPHLDPDATYKQVTLAINGKGARLRAEVAGSALGSARYQVRVGDLLVSKIDARKGAAAVVPAELDGAIVTADFPSFAVQGDIADPAYLDLVVRHPSFATLADSISGGTTNRVRMDLKRFPDLPLSLPPLAEQRRIVDLVNAVDDAREAASVELEAMRGFAESLRVAAFDGPDADPRALGSLCSEDGIQIGPFGSQVHAHDYLPEGVPMVMPRDIVDRRISIESIARISEDHAARLARHRLRVGDIVLPRRGDLTKRALVGPAEEGWLCGTGSARIRVSGVDPAVVFQALSVPAVDHWLAQNAVGATMPNLNTGIISRIPLKIPEDAERVVAALESIHLAADGLRSLAASLSSLRNGLLGDLLTGDHEIPESYDALLESA